MSDWSEDEGSRDVDAAARRVFRLGLLPDLSQLPELVTTAPYRSLYVATDVGTASKLEVHAVGVYTGESPDSRTDERTPQPVAVTVHAASAPVVLFLMSYDPIRWEIAVDDGAPLHGVVLSSYHPSTVTCAASLFQIVPLPNGPHEYSLESHEPDHPGGPGVIARLEKAVGHRITSFQGEYHGTRFDVPFYRDASAVREILVRCDTLARERTVEAPGPLLLIDAGFIRRVGSREEPIAVPDRSSKAVTYCDADERYYVVDDHILRAVDRTGSVEEIAPPDAARFSWLGGVAYDSKRRRLAIPTCWHAGEHWLYDPVGHRWESLSVDETGGGLQAIAYEPTRDVFFALAGGLLGPPLLVVLSPDLRPLGRIAHETLPLPPRMMPGSAIQIAAFPDAIVLCPTSEADWEDFPLDAPPRIEHGFVVRLDEPRIDRVDLRTDSSSSVSSGAPRDVEHIVEDAPNEGRPYEGWVYSADLVRDAPAIVEQIRTTETPLLVIHRSHAAAMLVNHEVYHGQLASLDEMSIEGWRDKLERANREIADGAFVPAPEVRGYLGPGPEPSGVPVRWTRQAAEDFESRDDRHPFLAMQLARIAGGAWSVPMYGPYTGFRATPVPPHTRIVFRPQDGEVIIGYIRGGVHALGQPSGRPISSRPDARE